MASKNKNVVSATCTYNSLENCSATDLTAFTAKYYSRRQFIIPMSATDVAQNFPATFDIFQATTTNSLATVGVTSTISNLVGGNEVSCPFLMCGICIQLSVEPNAWAMSCGELAAPVASPLVDYDGTTAIAAVPGGPIPMPATLEYGHCTWRAVIAFLQSYSLSFMLQCKYELFDVPLSDIGCIDSTNEVSAVGDSLVAAAIGFQRANQQLQNIGSGRRAVPALTQALLPAGVVQDGLAFQPMTRAMVGGPKGQGSLNGFYLCPTPILLAPCCRINMAFVENGESAISIGGDSYQHRRLVEELLDVPVLPYGPDLPSQVAGGAPLSAVNRTIKFGAFEIGVMMMGYEITTKACAQYFGSGLTPEMAAMYSMIPNMPGVQALTTRTGSLEAAASSARGNRRPLLTLCGAGGGRRFSFSRSPPIDGARNAAE